MWRAPWGLDPPEEGVDKAHDIELETRIFTSEELEKILGSFFLTALDASLW